MKLIFDPSLIWVLPYDEDKFKYLDELISFVDKLFGDKHISSDLLISLLQKLNKEPFDKYREPSYKKKRIIRSLFQLLDTDEHVTLINYNCRDGLLPSNYSLSYNEDANRYFNKLVQYIIENNTECILFLSPDNYTVNVEISPLIHYIRHIYKEENSYLAVLISEGVELKKDIIFSPTLDKPLPNRWLTKEYQTIREELIESGKASIATFLSLGKEVSLRNGYVFDEYLTKINSGAIREIFKSKTKPIIYLSTDIEHGAIEVFDNKPEHQGESNYIGDIKKGSKDPKKHKIILHK